jgi:signal transduction histidine kinase
MCTLGDKEELIAELCHQINSPLAAMRNAVYLAASRVHDPAVLHYLALADDEITAVAGILRETRALIEDVAAQAAACREADCRIVNRHQGPSRARAASVAMSVNGRAA